MSKRTSNTHPVDAIFVGERRRKDLGDIDGLAASIAEIGLLRPIVINSQGELIAGERRLGAVQQLGWADVPVTVVDIAEMVRGEFVRGRRRRISAFGLCDPRRGSEFSICHIPTPSPPSCATPLAPLSGEADGLRHQRGGHDARGETGRRRPQCDFGPVDGFPPSDEVEAVAAMQGWARQHDADELRHHWLAPSGRTGAVGGRRRPHGRR